MFERMGKGGMCRRVGEVTGERWEEEKGVWQSKKRRGGRRKAKKKGGRSINEIE